MSSKAGGSAWFSSKTRSSAKSPVRSVEAGAVKKASQFQPARSRLGQSMKTSAAFWRNVSFAASKIFTSAGSLARKRARFAVGFL